MGKSDRKSSAKREIQEALQIYLVNAKPAHISLAFWGVNWTDCHGETRSSSGRTFHIAARRNSRGHYITRIVDTRVGVIQGTEIDWGAKEPSLSRVLRYYQAMFGICEYPSSSDDDHAGSGSGGGKGGGGKGGGSGSSSNLNGPYADGYGGFFFTDSQNGYYPCDQAGKLLDSSGTSYSQAAYFSRYRAYR